MASDSETIFTPNRWGKVGKVALFLILFLLAGAGIGFGVYFRVTGFSDVLGQEQEIERKAKEYGMYSTRADFESVIQKLPKGYEMDSELGKIANRFESNTKGIKSNLNPYMNFSRSRKQERLILSSEMLKINSALTNSKSALEEVIFRKKPPLSNSWSMEKFFPQYDVRGVEQIQHVQEALLIEAWQEIEDANLSKALENIRFESKIRRYIASHYTNVEGAIYAVESWRTAALAYQRILEGMKSPPVGLIREMRQCIDTPIPFDFRHFSRVCFYMGADWFPVGRTIKEVARDEGNFLRFHPSIVRAWKLHLQSTAILAYEAGAKQSSDIEALEASIQTFSEKSYESKVCDSMRWALPEGGTGDIYMSNDFIEAPRKLKKYFQSHLKL